MYVIALTTKLAFSIQGRSCGNFGHITRIESVSFTAELQANATVAQCVKKGRVDLCQYAPKPVKVKPAKSMAARLKRLEGMVRGMLDSEAEMGPKAVDTSTAHVVQREGGTTYVGATHFMAMLDDVSSNIFLQDTALLTLIHR
jgi:hypothetical protein